MTPAQRLAEAETRARARRLLDDLDAFKATFADLRRALLAEPGVELLATRIRRRAGRRERLDLLRYRRPGGPRRAAWWIVEWGAGWDHASFLTAAEARLHFDTWNCAPAWLRAPLIIEESAEA